MQRGTQGRMQEGRQVYLMLHPRSLLRRTTVHAYPPGSAMNHSRNACSARSTLFAATILAAIGSGAAAAACTAVSPPHTLALAELYTSEGCDSCPPADRWMSGLQARGLGADKVVPLSLHVDYWDYIGWKDPFAQAQFTERQRQIARLASSTLVYTPQVVLAGRDFRGWAGGGFDSQVKTINAKPARAEIQLALDVVEGKVNVAANAAVKSAGATGAAGANSTKPQLFVALIQNRIVSPVKAGENRGVTLKHDYVVREWLGPLAFGADGKARLEKIITPPKGSPTNDLGVVAFVQDGANGEVLQALKLEACKS